MPIVVVVFVAAVAAPLATSVLGGAPAVAANNSTTLHGCANKHTGALRLARRCRTNETRVSWNIQGPPGVAGPARRPGAFGALGSDATTDGPYVWSAWLQPAGAARRPQPDGHVTTFRFTSPAAGFVDATAHCGVRVKNDGTTDCHVGSQLSDALGVPSPGPGYMDSWINANLPTHGNGGSYLQLDASASNVLPVVAGVNTIYLNGTYNCADALWGPVTVTAVLAGRNPAARLTAP